MKLSTSDLAALAVVYGVTVQQLMGPPEAAGLIENLDRAQGVIDGMTPESLEMWLSLGDTIKRGQK